MHEQINNIKKKPEQLKQENQLPIPNHMQVSKILKFDLNGVFLGQALSMVTQYKSITKKPQKYICNIFTNVKMQDQTNIFNEYLSVKKCILHIYRKQEDFNKAVTKDRYIVCLWHLWKYTNTEFWYRYKPGSKCVCALTTPYT